MFLQARNRSSASTKDATGGSPTVRIEKNTRMYTLRTSHTIVGYLAVISRILIPVPSEST